jgi:hypothetical protein
MSNYSDDVLVRKSVNGGRSMTALAVLVTLGTGLMLFVAVQGGDAFGFAFPAGLGLVALSYWVLSVAARRGDPIGVGLPALVMTLHVATAFILQAAMRAGDGGDQPYDLKGLIIPVVIVVVLARDWQILSTLKKRGLQDQAFPARKPTTALCAVGGVTLVAGFVVIYASLFATGADMRARLKDLAAEAKAFETLIVQDEAHFQDTLKALAGAEDGGPYQASLKEVGVLLAKVEAMRDDPKTGPTMKKVLTTYAAAVAQWKSGLAAAPEDVEAAEGKLRRGDALRDQAIAQFRDEVLIVFKKRD